jgi:predicted Zn-dependent peptidase
MKLQRKIQPEIQPVELKSIPEAELFYLKNGVPVYLIEAGSEELMRVDFIFDAGQVKEDFPIVASTTNSMLLEGSLNYTAKEINNTFDFYGAFINLLIQKDSSAVTVFFLNKHIEKILELCFEILFRHAFPADELNNLQKKRLQSFLLNRQKVQNLATDKFFESVFGPVHPYGKQVSPVDFENVTTSMLLNFHTDNYSQGNMAVIISGRIHKESKAILNHFFGNHNFKSKMADIKNIPIIGNKNKREFVEKKGALQSAIRVGSATINKRHKDYYGLLILDTILGGYFGSRLMKNIREEKGYTYGINSSLMSLNQSGYKVIITEVGKKHTGKALDEIYKEIRQLQTKPVEVKELEIARSYLAGEMVRMFDGPFALAESFRAVWEFGLDNNYYYNLAEKIKTIEPDEIIDLANTYYKIDDLYEITAGSK